MSQFYFFNKFPLIPGDFSVSLSALALALAQIFHAAVEKEQFQFIFRRASLLS